MLEESPLKQIALEGFLLALGVSASMEFDVGEITHVYVEAGAISKHVAKCGGIESESCRIATEGSRDNVGIGGYSEAGG